MASNTTAPAVVKPICPRSSYYALLTLTLPVRPVLRPSLLFLLSSVGATGAVGIELISCLYARVSKFGPLPPRLFASPRSAGKSLPSGYGPLTVEAFDLTTVVASDFDVIFLAVSGDFSLQYAKSLIGPLNRTYVIDNSSAFRYDPLIPLIVPEVNASALSADDRLIANPNCTTAIAVLALKPLHDAYGLEAVLMSTYQAASGAGAEGMDELRVMTQESLVPPPDGRDPVTNKIFAYPLPFNLIPHIDKFQDNGYTKEEMKVVWETRKILGIPDLPVSCTAVRVPVLRAHSESIIVRTTLPCPAVPARLYLSRAKGLQVRDDVSATPPVYPMPMTASGQDDVQVGRIRQSLVFGERGLEFFVVGDQLLRGAALNAVVIAEVVLKR